MTRTDLMNTAIVNLPEDLQNSVKFHGIGTMDALDERIWRELDTFSPEDYITTPGGGFLNPVEWVKKIEEQARYIGMPMVKGLLLKVVGEEGYDALEDLDDSSFSDVVTRACIIVYLEAFASAFKR